MVSYQELDVFRAVPDRKNIKFLTKTISYVARLSFSFSFFPCSADHERDWPPCKKIVFFGLATNAPNVRKQQHYNTVGYV